MNAAKKQTVYEVLLNAMATAKTKHSLDLPKDSLYDELITKTRQMPDDVKEMLGHATLADTNIKKVSRSRSRNKSLEEPRAQRPSHKRVTSEPAPSLKKKFDTSWGQCWG